MLGLCSSSPLGVYTRVWKRVRVWVGERHPSPPMRLFKSDTKGSLWKVRIFFFGIAWVEKASVTGKRMSKGWGTGINWCQYTGIDEEKLRCVTLCAFVVMKTDSSLGVARWYACLQPGAAPTAPPCPKIWLFFSRFCMLFHKSLTAVQRSLSWKSSTSLFDHCFAIFDRFSRRSSWPSVDVFWLFRLRLVIWLCVCSLFAYSIHTGNMFRVTVFFPVLALHLIVSGNANAIPSCYWFPCFRFLG